MLFGKLIGFYSRLFYGGKEIGKGTLSFPYQSRILLRRNNICGYALLFCSSEKKNRCVWLSLLGKEIYSTIVNNIVRRMVFFLSLMIWDSQRFYAIPWVRGKNTIRLFFPLTVTGGGVPVYCSSLGEALPNVFPTSTRVPTSLLCTTLAYVFSEYFHRYFIILSIWKLL